MFFKSRIWINGAVQSGKEKPLNGYVAVFQYLKRGLLKKMERDKYCGLEGSLDLVIFMKTREIK